MHSNQTTICSDSFDRCAILEDDDDDDADDDDDDDGDDDDNLTCESTIGVKRGEDELI